MAVQTYTATLNKVKSRKILIAGLASMAAAVFANLVTRAILATVLDLPAGFQPFNPIPISLFTILGTGLGVLVFTLLNRRARHPQQAYLIVAVIAFCLSITPNFALMANPAAAPIPGGTPMAFGALVVFHVVAALVHLSVFLPMVMGQE